MAPAMLNKSSKTVCVMDASGLVGTTLVHSLLQRGYIVHAALHNYHHDIDEYLQTLERGNESKNYNKKLRVFHSDPLDYYSIMDALKGCSALFYSFDPPPQQPSYDEFMDELEVRAAHNVVEACAQTDTIEKVVFTSSATAVIWRDHHQGEDGGGNDDIDVTIDERNWSDISFCRKFKLWHGLSKTMAEKAAWSLAMDRGLNMVTINSGLIMSPELTIKEPYLKGAAEMFEDGILVTVDLKFLVDAHICVFEDVSSYGRYLCFNRVINSNKDAVKLANMLLPPSSNEQHQSMDDKKSNYQHVRISNKKLCKLMVDYDNTSSQLVASS
ncbi:dehydratase [Lithospermum erythrorhizon]|uniref:Dehydratase n=1 Tax=Lithospermum erythrorhizon TaxID=34254 RepID=A0AAV3Q1Q5_LITER